MSARLLLTLLLIAAAAPALGATCTSRASNNWNNAATWTCTAGMTPANGDTVIIANGNAVTANVDANPASITVSGGNANTSLTVNTGVTLDVSGAVTINAATGGTARTKRITVNGTAQLLIGGNLSINNGGAAGSIADLTIANNAAARVQVAGNVTFSGTPAPSITFAGAGTLSVAGSMDNDGSLAAGTGTVTYTSNAAGQNIGTYTYSTLLINKSGGSATASATISASNLGISTTSGAVAVTANFNTTTAALSTSGGAALSLTGNLTATTSAALTTASGAALTMTGNLNAATATFATASNAAITVNGAVSGTSATFTNADTGPVTINGALTTNLTFASGNAGLTSVNTSSTAGSLTFASGNTGLLAMTGGTTLTVTGNCTTSVTRLGSGHVNGILKLTYPAGTPSCTYHVGDATNYTPITVALTGATAGTITGRVTASAPPNLSISPLSSSKYVNRYWTLGGAGDTATATSYGATLNWVAGDIQGGANYQNFIVGENQGGWIVPGPGASANAASSIVATNVTTAFGSAASFGVGEAYACLPPANIPPGVTVGCVCDTFGRANLNPSSIFNSNWLLSTSSGSFGIPKIINQGRLQLTNATNDNASAATVPGIFPAAGNYISVEFQQYAYNNASGADGIAVTLSDYSVAPTPGAYGGSLGYAQKTGINGFAGGWIGVALDEYGNFENNTEGRSGGTPPCAGQCRDSVGIRGSGSGNAATATNYPWLAGNTTASNSIDSGNTPGPGHMYQIIVDARTYTTGAKTARVSVNRDATTQTGANYTPVVAPFDAYMVNPSQAAVPVNWQISFTGSTGGSTNIHEIGNLKVCAQTLIPPTGSSTAAGFNAIDSALPNTKQNALFGHIYTKVAGVNFKLNVAALAPPVGGVSQGVNTAYASSAAKTVTVKLFDDSQAGGSCIASAAACAACSKTQVASQTMTFTSADAGFKTSADFAFTLPGAYKRLIAQISDGTTTGCSVDAFAVRPASYALTSSAAPKTKAGVSFTITATPQNISNGALTGAPGSPTLDSTKAPAVSGTQTLFLQSWNSGATSGAFIYNDVGNFSLPANAIYDAQYSNASGEAQDRTNGDCNPGSGAPYVPATTNTVDSAGKFGCDIGSVASPSFGRFYPDHYEASLGATQACSADGFSYMGQPFSMTSASSGSMQIKALAAGQTFATAPGLPSYTGGYTPRASVWFGAQNGVGSTTDLIRCVSSTQNATTDRCVTTTLPYKPAVPSTWTAGSFTVTPTTYYFDPPKDATTTPDSTWGPYDSLSVGVTVSDSDGSTLTIPGGQSFVLNGDTYQSVNGSLPMKMRYGRMRIQNASGSEQVPIVVPVWLEYWTGSAWMPNLLDTTCTRLLGPPPTAYSGNSVTAACYGGAGGSGTQCTSPTAGGVGSIYTTQLNSVPANSGVPAYSAATFSYGQRNVVLAAPKATGTLGVSVQAPAWLKIGPANATGTNPTATVRYSSYNSRFIFLRENY